MITTPFPNILQLSVSERIQLVEDIWDTITISPEEVDLSETQRQELDQRLELYRQYPKKAASWEEVKKRLTTLL